MKIKQKKIEEEGDVDDQCSADMLLRGVIITVWYVEPVWIYDFLLFQRLKLLYLKIKNKEKGFQNLFRFCVCFVCLEWKWKEENQTFSFWVNCREKVFVLILYLRVSSLGFRMQLQVFSSLKNSLGFYRLF